MRISSNGWSARGCASGRSSFCSASPTPPSSQKGIPDTVFDGFQSAGELSLLTALRTCGSVVVSPVPRARHRGHPCWWLMAGKAWWLPRSQNRDLGTRRSNWWQEKRGGFSGL